MTRGDGVTAGDEAGPAPFVLGDRAVVAVAVAAVLGARLGGGPGVAVGMLLGLAGLGLRRSALVVLAVGVVAAGVADRAAAGREPVASGRLDDWVVLAGDPERLDTGGVRVLVRHDGDRLEATAYGAGGARLEGRLAGEHVALHGRLSPVDRDDTWSASRGVVGRLAVDDVGEWRPGSAASRAANGLRRTLEAGADHLPARTRSLLLGVVLGDDRGQPPEVGDDFRAAGMTHLQAVSGQNVAFVLVLLGPVLTRLRWRSRLPLTLLAVGFFCLVVRFEPSVVRAAGMTAIATVATAVGRPTAGIRVLGLAVAGLVLADPLLATSLGFGLSACASAGILLVGPRLREVLGGPAPLRELLAVTLAAQAGALPLLLTTFGSVPVATVPANLLAVPAAGPLMVWGLGAGLLAGVGPGWLASALHVPTSLLAWWLAEVAAWGAGLPLGAVDGTALAVGGLAGAVVAGAVALGGRSGPGPGRLGVLAATVVVLVVAGSGRPAAPPGWTEVDRGLTLAVVGQDRVLVVERAGSAEAALAALRRRGVRCVDVVAVAGGGRAAGALAGALARRCAGLRIVAPEDRAHPGWSSLAPDRPLVVGALVVAATGAGDIVVRAAPPAGGAALESRPRATPLPPAVTAGRARPARPP